MIRLGKKVTSISLYTTRTPITFFTPPPKRSIPEMSLFLKIDQILWYRLAAMTEVFCTSMQSETFLNTICVHPPSLVCGGGLIFPFLQVGEGGGSCMVSVSGSRAVVKIIQMNLSLLHIHISPQCSRLDNYIYNSYS